LGILSKENGKGQVKLSAVAEATGVSKSHIKTSRRRVITGNLGAFADQTLKRGKRTGIPEEERVRTHYTHTHTNTQTPSHTHPPTHTHTHTHTHTDTHTHTHPPKHTHTHAHTHTHTHTTERRVSGPRIIRFGGRAAGE
jgi:hypothetical protein